MSDDGLPPTTRTPMRGNQSESVRAKRRASSTPLSSFIVVGIVLVMVLVIAGIRWLMPHPIDPTPAPAPLLTSVTAGYSGTAQNTHALSPAWASGVDTAWRIPLEPTSSVSRPIIYSEGSILYVVIADNNGTSNKVRADAYDVSESTPRQLWQTSGLRPDYFSASRIVATDDQLLGGSLVIDKETGTQSQAPWASGEAIAVAHGVVVTCTRNSECTGWRREASSWHEAWKSRTRAPDLNSYDDTYTGVFSGAVMSSGGKESILLSVTDPRTPAQLINPDTGTVVDLGLSDDESSSEGHRDVLLASDGLVVVGDRTRHTLNAEGFIVDMQPYEPSRRIPTNGGTVPTTAQLNDFLAGGMPAWTSATVEIEETGDCKRFTLTPTDGSPAHRVTPSTASAFRDAACAIAPDSMRASSDGSVLSLETVRRSSTSEFFFIDATSGQVYASEELNGAHSRTWVFDDLLVAVTDEGIAAFTPHSF